MSLSVLRLTLPSVVPSVTVKVEDKLFTALVTVSLAICLTSAIFAALVPVVPPLATLVIAALPASIPVVVTDGPPVKRNPVAFIDAAPDVNVVPVNVLALTAPDVPSNVIRLVPEPTFTVLAAVTESNVRSFFVLTVIFLPSVPSCVISMLSPLMRSTVLPPDTFVAVPPLVEMFHAEPSLADVTALVIASFTTVVMLSAVTTPSAALLIVPSVFVDNVPFLTVTFTASVVALVDTKAPSPATLNARPPDLLRF